MKHTTPRFLLALALVGCGSSAETPAAPATPTPAVAPTPPPPPAMPPALALGAPATAVTVPAAPGFAFTVGAPAEYQLDVTGDAPSDAQLYLFANGSYSNMDSDSGDGVNARLISFLTPGAYEVRAAEWRHRAMSAHVSVTLLPPLTPAGVTMPGGPPMTVNTLAAETDRESSAEVTLTVAAPGNYRIDAISPTCDAQLLLHANGAEIGRDSDSGDANNAQLTTMLQPGAYNLRVYDWMHRACPITVSVALAP